VGDSGASGAARHPAWGVLPASLLGGLLLAPTLFAGFFGDDFKLWHVARRMLDAPATLFVGSQNFYRPANSWLFAANHLLFGNDPLGYHAGTLALHLACGALVGLLAARFVASPWIAFGAAAAWTCSPYAFEPVQFVNVAYNDLTVLLVWLVLGVTWPGRGCTFTRWRVAAYAALVTFSLVCKESWVIVPGLVLAYERALRGVPWRTALRSASIAALPVLAYVLAYPFVFPGRESYYDVGWWAASRAPHLWASFSMLAELVPYKTGWGGTEWMGLALLIATALLGWRTRSRPILLGLALFVSSLAPVIFIPYLPTRYTTVPYAGFVLAACGVLVELVRLAGPRRRVAAAAGAALLASAHFGAGLLWLLGDVEDMQRLQHPHETLVAEVAAFADRIPVDRPVVCVRLESVDPLLRLDAEGALGVPKLYFQRPATPYGLADWAQLFTFARSGRGDEVLVDLGPDEAAADGPFAVVAHVPGGFVELDPKTSRARDELVYWQQAGRPACLVGPAAPAPGEAQASR
jgi:hypothetical protein